MKRDYILLNTPADSGVAQVMLPQAEQAAATSNYIPSDTECLKIDSIIRNLRVVCERGM